MTQTPQPQSRCFKIGTLSNAAANATVSGSKFPYLTLLQGVSEGEHYSLPAQSLSFSGHTQLEDIRTAIDWLLETSKPVQAQAPTAISAQTPAESADKLFWNNRPAVAMRALNDIKAERHRQMMVEGWTAQHDDEHFGGMLAIAAASYALSGAGFKQKAEDLWATTGWAWSWFKPKHHRHDLIRAAALLLAEIERLDRATAKLEQAK